MSYLSSIFPLSFNSLLPPSFFFNNCSNELYLLEILEGKEEEDKRVYFAVYFWQSMLRNEPDYLLRKEVQFFNNQNKKMSVSQKNLKLIENLNYDKENKFVAISDEESLWVANLNTIKNANYSAALFQQINIPLTPIIAIKFLHHGPGHIAILNENFFFIFDLEKNIDNPEIMINLNEISKGNKYGENEIRECDDVFIDFEFSENRHFFDLAFFSIFFLTNQGRIFYICPFIINNMVVSKKEFEFLRKRYVNQPEIMYFCELINEIKKNICFESSSISIESQIINDYMILDGVSFTNYDFINDFNFSYAFNLVPPLPEKETLLKFIKVKNLNGHLFALLTKSKIYLYATTQNIWITNHLESEISFEIEKLELFLLETFILSKDNPISFSSIDQVKFKQIDDQKLFACNGHQNILIKINWIKDLDSNFYAGDFRCFSILRKNYNEMILLGNFDFSIVGEKLFYLEKKQGEWFIDMFDHEEKELDQIVQGQKEGKEINIEKLKKKKNFLLHDYSEEICLNINDIPDIKLEYKNLLKSWFINFDKEIDDSFMEIEKKLAIIGKYKNLINIEFAVLKKKIKTLLDYNFKNHLSSIKDKNDQLKSKIIKISQSFGNSRVVKNFEKNILEAQIQLHSIKEETNKINNLKNKLFKPEKSQKISPNSEFAEKVNEYLKIKNQILNTYSRLLI